MRVGLLAVAAAIGVASVSLWSEAAEAQAQGSWFFCYVDPPTFNRGTYVYTKVSYIGSAMIPQADIVSTMARTEPQAASRQPTCWRYASEAEAEQRRFQGMAADRSAGFTVREVAWTSPYAPPPAREPAVAEPVIPVASPPVAAPVAVAAPISTAPAAPPATAPATASPAPVAPAATATVAPAVAAGVSSSAAPTKRPMTKAEADADYQRRLAAYEIKRAEYERQQAQYLQALQAEASRMEGATSRAEQELNRYKQQREQWEADVAACKAGDQSKCAPSPEPQAPPQQ